MNSRERMRFSINGRHVHPDDPRLEAIKASLLAASAFAEQMEQVRAVSGGTETDLAALEDDHAAADAEAGRWPVG